MSGLVCRNYISLRSKLRVLSNLYIYGSFSKKSTCHIGCMCNVSTLIHTEHRKLFTGENKKKGSLSKNDSTEKVEVMKSKTKGDKKDSPPKPKSTVFIWDNRTRIATGMMVAWALIVAAIMTYDILHREERRYKAVLEGQLHLMSDADRAKIEALLKPDETK